MASRIPADPAQQQRASAGLTTKEIYDSTGHRFAVRPVLETHPRLFTADAAGRWLLGIPAIVPA